MNTTNITPRITEESLKPLSITAISPQNNGVAASYLPSYFSDIKVIIIVILIILVILLIFYIFKTKPNEQEKRALIQAEQDINMKKSEIRNRLLQQQQQQQQQQQNNNAQTEAIDEVEANAHAQNNEGEVQEQIVEDEEVGDEEIDQNIEINQ